MCLLGGRGQGSSKARNGDQNRDNGHMKVKEENDKVGLKHNIKITKSMASGPITSWQIDGETVESVTD